MDSDREWREKTPECGTNDNTGLIRLADPSESEALLQASRALRRFEDSKSQASFKGVPCHQKVFRGSKGSRKVPRCPIGYFKEERRLNSSALRKAPRCPVENFKEERPLSSSALRKAPRCRRGKALEFFCFATGLKTANRELRRGKAFEIICFARTRRLPIGSFAGCFAKDA